jgi:hypothetical protein
VRGGLLGQGSVLTTTSYPDRTSPTTRGKWLLENVLGAPPPPPPPDVPALTDRGRDDKPMAMRERMEAHRANPVCASCHRQMDPLGFSLENFDAIGHWRAASDGIPLDVSGALPDGTPFNGPRELRALLVERRDEFVTTVTEKLLIYALGRGLDAADMPAIRRIMRDAAPSGYRWSALALAIARSQPFQMRTAGDAMPSATAGAEKEKADP